MPTSCERFQREAKAAARLHHTNIVPVFGVGEHDGCTTTPCSSSPAWGSTRCSPSWCAARGRSGDGRVAEGNRSRRGAARRSGSRRGPLAGRPAADAVPAETLPPVAPASPTAGSRRRKPPVDAWPTRGRAPTAQSVARIGVQVADALAYAHRQGVLHRDVKPSNLLLDAQGTSWVTDFGLAKAASDGDDLTHTGDIVGTLRYMAPERFDGQCDTRSATSTPWA